MDLRVVVSHAFLQDCEPPVEVWIMGNVCHGSEYRSWGRRLRYTSSVRRQMTIPKLGIRTEIVSLKDILLY